MHVYTRARTHTHAGLKARARSASTPEKAVRPPVPTHVPTPSSRPGVHSAAPSDSPQWTALRPQRARGLDAPLAGLLTPASPLLDGPPRARTRAPTHCTESKRTRVRERTGRSSRREPRAATGPWGSRAALLHSRRPQAPLRRKRGGPACSREAPAPRTSAKATATPRGALWGRGRGGVTGALQRAQHPPCLHDPRLCGRGARRDRGCVGHSAPRGHTCRTLPHARYPPRAAHGPGRQRPRRG